MDLSELNLSVRDYNAVKRFGISSAEELVERLPYFCEHAKATAGRVTEALHECGMLTFKLGQWVEPDQCGEEIEPEELEAGEFVVMGFPTESKDWRKVVMIRAADGDDLLYLDGSGGAPHCRLGDHRVWSIRSEKEEDTSMNEETKNAVVVSEDYTRAVTLTRSIIANAQAAQQSLYEVCKGLKEMRDGKLYRELGYQNFEDYTENEVGIKRRQAHNYIMIAENMSAENVQSIAQIGSTKLTMLAMLDEPTREAVTETVDVESVTVKELREHISRVESENADLGQKLDAANESLSSKSKQFKEAMDAKDKQLKAVKESGEQSLSECKAYLNGRIHDLEKRIHDMENAPIDHDMTDADAAEEIKRLKRQLEDEQLRFTVLEGDAAAKARRAAEEVRQEYEKKIAEMQSAQPAEQEAAADTKAVFKAYLANAADALTRLLTYLESIRDDKNLPLYISKVDGIVEMTQTRRNAL